ncbi:hypothetical protein GCM10027318_34180 [Massilia agilis]
MQMSDSIKDNPAADEVIVSYKGFDQNWRCRGFQYALGETFTHDGKVEACASGFHACEYPLDVLNYYPPAGNKFAIVEQSGELSRHSEDTKVASKVLKVSAEITLPGLIKAAIEYTVSRCNPVDPESPAYSKEAQGAASATGTRGAASATGYSGAASATGDSGAASATGTRGAASATGDSGAASATGPHSVAMASGYAGRAMAGETGAIVLVYRNDEDQLVHIRASKVGDNGIKAGVWYSLDAEGQFVECVDAEND